MGVQVTIDIWGADELVEVGKFVDALGAARGQKAQAAAAAAAKAAIDQAMQNVPQAAATPVEAAVAAPTVEAVAAITERDTSAPVPVTLTNGAVVPIDVSDITVTNAARAAVTTKGLAAVQNALAELGAKRVLELDPEQRVAFLARLAI